MLNKSEIAILTIAVSIGSQNYFKMKQCRHFMQITYSPNNVLITMSCRLRGGCERLRGSSCWRLAKSKPQRKPAKADDEKPGKQVENANDENGEKSRQSVLGQSLTSARCTPR